MNKVLWVEVPIQGTAAGNTIQQINFPDQPFLGGKFIISIEVFTVNDVPVSPFGNPVVGSTVFKNAFLNLYGQDPEDMATFGNWFQNIPLVSMHRQVNGTDPYVYDKYALEPRQISFTNSQILLSQPPNNTATFSFLFAFGYQNTYY